MSDFSLETNYIRDVSNILAEMRLVVDETNSRLNNKIKPPRINSTITLVPDNHDIFGQTLLIKQGGKGLGRIRWLRPNPHTICFRVTVAGKSLMSKDMQYDISNVEEIKAELAYLLNYFFPGYIVLS